MFTETLNSTSRNEEIMELDNSIEDPDDEDEEFPPLPSDIDLPAHITPQDPYDNRHNTMDLFYCASPPLPSPPPPAPPPTSAATLARMYANARTFSSIHTHDSYNHPVSFATQQKKKIRAPIACLLEGLYVNIPMPPPPTPPPPPSPPKPENISNEVTYATLMNTTSLIPSIYSDLTMNHVEYQQIQIQHESDEINHNRIYENIKSRRPPPLPYLSQSISPQQSISLEIDKSLSPSKIFNNDIIPSSSAHIYINLQYHEDKPPAIPTRTCKSIPITIQTSSSPPPPVIPPRNEHKKALRFSSSSVATSPIETEQDEKDINAVETSSNASTVQVSLFIFQKRNNVC
jgi:hypothetical protein